MIIVCQQTILMEYHALFVIFEKAANFFIVVCCKLLLLLFQFFRCWGQHKVFWTSWIFPVFAASVSINYMGESFQDYSWIQDFEADFP